MMNKQELQPGLNFAVQYDLSVRDMEILLKLLEADYTTDEVADIFKESKNNIYRVVQRLLFKNLIIPNGKRPISYSIIYTPNPELIHASKVVDAEEFAVDNN